MTDNRNELPETGLKDLGKVAGMFGINVPQEEQKTTEEVAVTETPAETPKQEEPTKEAPQEEVKVEEKVEETATPKQETEEAPEKKEESKTENVDELRNELLKTVEDSSEKVEDANEKVDEAKKNLEEAEKGGDAGEIDKKTDELQARLAEKEKAVQEKELSLKEAQARIEALSKKNDSLVQQLTDSEQSDAMARHINNIVKNNDDLKAIVALAHRAEANPDASKEGLENHLKSMFKKYTDIDVDALIEKSKKAGGFP